MNIRLLLLGVVSGIITLISCNDDLKLVGNTIKGDDDGINVIADTFRIAASTVKVDSIYAKSVYAVLGEMYDPLYGNLKADYITQFYCPEDFSFEVKPVDGKIDSLKFVILYSSYNGDSIAPMQVELFEVTSPPERHYYSNFDPKKYSNMQNSLGKKVYTPRDLNYTDSAWNASTVGYRTLEVDMAVSYGQNLYDWVEENGSVNQQQFNEFIKGIYVTNTSGTGNVLNIIYSSMDIYFQGEFVTEDQNGNDSTYVAQATFQFVNTKEVIQLNRFENTDMDELLRPNDEYTYVKSPAGVYTKLVFPTVELMSKIEDRTVNNLFFEVKVMPDEDTDFALSPPDYLLLLPEDSLNVHFEKGRMSDSYTSFVSSKYNATTRTYNFNNIANIVSMQKLIAPEEDLRVLIVPVEGIETQTSTSSTSLTGITNKFQISGAQIRKDGDYMEFVITTSKFKAEK